MTVNNNPNSVFGNRFLFTGREWLSDLRLYDYRNRLYQSELGRFLQPDPMGFTGESNIVGNNRNGVFATPWSAPSEGMPSKRLDSNLYRYCHNDPVNHMDPMGLDTLALGIGVNGAFGLDIRASLQFAIQTGPNGLSLGYIGSIQPLTGVSTGVGGALSAVGTYSKASLSEVNGMTGNFGGSVALGPSVGYDVGNVGSTKADGTPANVTHNVSIGVGLKPSALVAPAEVHAGATFTKAGLFNKDDRVEKEK